jgi:hypothetical protein
MLTAADPVAVPESVTNLNPSENLDIVELKNSALSKMSEVEEEPILKRNHKRFVLFPIQYHEVKGVLYSYSLSSLSS